MRAVGAPLDAVARECDRLLLSKAQRLAGDVRRALLRLLEAPGRALPERLREVAERVVRLLDDPRGVYLAYYPVTPAVRHLVTDVAVGYCFSFEQAFPGGGRRLTYVVLFPPCRVATSPELRYVLAHELAHAAGYEDEHDAGLLAHALERHFPRDFEDVSLLLPFRFLERVEAGEEELVPLEEFARWVEAEPAEFHEALLRCREGLRPAG